MKKNFWALQKLALSNLTLHHGCASTTVQWSRSRPRAKRTGFERMQRRIL